MKFASRLKASNALIDLTPLVDVIFLLLIFFILTSDILPLKSLNVENPKISQNSAPMTTQLLVVLDAHHALYLGHNREIIDLSSFRHRLEEEMNRLRDLHPGTELTVVLSVDRRVEYGVFLKLFAQAQAASPRVRLVYQPERDRLTQNMGGY